MDVSLARKSGDRSKSRGRGPTHFLRVLQAGTGDHSQLLCCTLLACVVVLLATVVTIVRMQHAAVATAVSAANSASPLRGLHKVAGDGAAVSPDLEDFLVAQSTKLQQQEAILADHAARTGDVDELISRAQAEVAAQAALLGAKVAAAGKAAAVGAAQAVAPPPAAVPAAAPAALGTFVPGSTTFAGPQNPRQEAVADAMKWAWEGYRKYAWGKDELHPLSMSGEDWFGLGLTLIDALDTMYIMGPPLRKEFDTARSWVADSLHFDATTKDVNLFETTIRVLGGLLSTYALTGDKVFLQKADTLGTLLLPAFQTPSGVPVSDVNLHSHSAHKPSWGSASTTAEVTTIQLEFRYLAVLTGKRKYYDVVEKVNEVVAGDVKGNRGTLNGLVPKFINSDSGAFQPGLYTLGARGDSYYEYLLKQWLQTRRSEDIFRARYVQAMRSVTTRMLKKSTHQGFTFVAELGSDGGTVYPKMDHLVCFLSGTLALGHHYGIGTGTPSDSGEPNHLEATKEVGRTCNEMYAVTATHLAGEITHFNHPGGQTYGDGTKDLFVKRADSHNLLRPETVESLFYLYRLTRDRKYQDWGWEIFQAFEKYSRVSTGGYASLDSATDPSAPKRDKMESFFLGETLKYFYLLFDDSAEGLLPFDKFVFNTEAHPLPTFDKAELEKLR